MEIIGRINKRKIYYIQVRNNPQWKYSLPTKDWIAFTISNKEDEELVPPTVRTCLNKNVSYTCSAGNFAEMTEEYFDEEISWNKIGYKNEKLNNNIPPTTTAHESIEDGLWFATTLAYIENFELDKVVCIDLTKRKVRKYLVELIEKLNNNSSPNP